MKKYEHIYQVVQQIPPGRVATYGQIARLAGGCTPRMVGYALASLPPALADEVPWQRVINRTGQVSLHGCGIGSHQQRLLLEDEGIEFNPNGQIDFDRFGWLGAP